MITGYRLGSLLALGCFSLLADSPALAASWARLSGSTTGDQIWADVTSISEEGGIRTAWIRTVYQRPNREGATSDMSRFHYDCGNRETALLDVIYYGVRGRVVSSSQVRSLNWRPVVPESVGEGDFNFVCTYPIGTNPREIAGLVIEP